MNHSKIRGSHYGNKSVNSRSTQDFVSFKMETNERDQFIFIVKMKSLVLDQLAFSVDPSSASVLRASFS